MILNLIESYEIFLRDIFANNFAININKFLKLIDKNSYNKIIYHVDNVTITSLINYDNRIDLDIIIYNYDNDRNLTPTRVVQSSYLNLVHLQSPQQFAKFTAIDTNIKYLDIIVFLIDNTNFNYLYATKNLQNSGGVFAYNYVNDTFYRANYFQNNANFITELINYDEIKRNDYKNFNGHKFRVGFTLYPPFAYIT